MALANVPHLDVHQEVQETLTSLGPGLVYNRLLRLQSGPVNEVPQPSLRLECELCESWQMVDHLTYRFQLRKGIRWQDISPVKGREVTAQDVVSSYDRLRTPGWVNAPLLQNLRTVEAEGNYTLRITLSPEFPDADFLLSLANGHTKVVAKEVVEEHGDLKEAPVIGSGPWIWDPKRSREDIGSVFVKNPGYFEEGLPFLDEFIISVIREESTRNAAFATGKVDVYRISPQSWSQLKRRGGEFRSFLSRQGGTGLILTMNVSAPPFDNTQVRKAVLKALDPWDYVDAIWSGQGFVSLGLPVQRPDWLLTRAEMRESYFSDPSGARNTLRGTGLTTPVQFRFTVADYGDIYLQQGRQIEQNLRSVGFDPALAQVSPSQYEAKVWRDKEYQLAIGELPPTSTTNAFLFTVLHGSGRWKVLGSSDGQLDKMIVGQAATSDSMERGKLVRDIQRHLLERAYLFSPVSGVSRWVSGPRVKGFYPNTAGSEYFYWAKTWVE